MKASGIGGQALMEGVMMKNGSKYACAIRKPDGDIIVDVQETHSISEKCKIFKWPIIRGVVTFVESLVIGVKTLTYSASFFDEEEDSAAEDKNDGKNNAKKNAEKSSTGKSSGKSGASPAQKGKIISGEQEKAEKTPAEKRKETAMMAGLVVLATIFAIALFMILPYFLSLLLKKFITSTTVLAIIEGFIRIGLFVGYVAAISCMKDIQRVFMYHGAEHKSINCIEHGFELTVENVREQSKEHKRCGTSFLLIVMVISVIFFVFIRVNSTWLMVLIRLLLIPVIAGISYEFIRVAGKSDNKIIVFLSKPGLLLQKCTTREPDDSMIECAIASVEAVFDWKKYQEEARLEEEVILEERRSALEQKRNERIAESRKRLAARGYKFEFEKRAEAGDEGTEDGYGTDISEDTWDEGYSDETSESIDTGDGSDITAEAVSDAAYEEAEAMDAADGSDDYGTNGTDEASDGEKKKAEAGQKSSEDKADELSDSEVRDMLDEYLFGARERHPQERPENGKVRSVDAPDTRKMNGTPAKAASDNKKDNKPGKDGKNPTNNNGKNNSGKNNNGKNNNGKNNSERNNNGKNNTGKNNTGKNNSEKNNSEKNNNGKNNSGKNNSGKNRNGKAGSSESADPLDTMFDRDAVR